ncbi:MAG: acetyl-CoA carboxylase biotin carboxyl carrier protein [Phycisphaerales bacterium]|nr:MAG: acetyl-CoA carboxylase biotin carboxyl carrier protein [Phycisphaerales bacterium]
MIDIRKLKELVRLMVENELSELDLRDQEETVTIKRGHADQPVVHYAPQPMAHTPQPASGGAGTGTSAPPPDTSGDGLIAIESPMVGTFYSAPTPDSDPFIVAGSSLSPGSTVCLVEAMKVFNEIKAEIGGTVERVLVNNGDSVEFGQKLFLVKPA